MSKPIVAVVGRPNVGQRDVASNLGNPKPFCNFDLSQAVMLPKIFRRLIQ